MRREAAQLFAGMVAGLAVAFVSSVIVARGLGPVGRGEFALLSALIGAWTVVGLGGVHVAFRSLYPKGETTVAALDRALRFQAPVAGAACAGCAAMVLGTAASPGAWTLLLLIAISAALSVWSMAALDLVKADGRHGLSGVVDVSGAIITLVLVCAFWFADRLSVPAALVAYGIGYFARTVVGHHLMSSRSSVSATASATHAVGLQREGRRYFGFTAGQYLALQSDVLVAGLFLASAELGYYGAASTLAALTRLPGMAIGHVLGHRAALGDDAVSLRRDVVSGTGIGVAIAVIVGVFAQSIVVRIYGPAFEPAAQVLRVLVLGQIFIAAYPIVSRILAGQGRPKEIALSGYLAGVTLVGAMAVATPRWGSVGAAWAAVATYLVLIITLVSLTLRSTRGSA